MTFNQCGFQERIRLLRKQKGYTQQQLADIFHISKSNINYYEKSTRAPRLSTSPMPRMRLAMRSGWNTSRSSSFSPVP